MKRPPTHVYLVRWPRSGRPGEVQQKVYVSAAGAVNLTARLKLAGKPLADIEVWRAECGTWTQEATS